MCITHTQTPSWLSIIMTKSLVKFQNELFKDLLRKCKRNIPKTHKICLTMLIISSSWQNSKFFFTTQLATHVIAPQGSDTPFQSLLPPFLMGEGFMGGVYTPPFTIFFDFRLRSLRYEKDFLPVLSKLSQASMVKIFHFSDEWKVVSVAPQRGGVHPP